MEISDCKWVCSKNLIQKIGEISTICCSYLYLHSNTFDVHIWSNNLFVALNLVIEMWAGRSGAEARRQEFASPQSWTIEKSRQRDPSRISNFFGSTPSQLIPLTPGETLWLCARPTFAISRRFISLHTQQTLRKFVNRSHGGLYSQRNSFEFCSSGGAGVYLSYWQWFDAYMIMLGGYEDRQALHLDLPHDCDRIDRWHGRQQYSSSYELFPLPHRRYFLIGFSP